MSGLWQDHWGMQINEPPPLHRRSYRQLWLTLLAFSVGAAGVFALACTLWVVNHPLDVYLITRSQVLNLFDCKLFVPVLVTNDDGERMALYQCKE